MKYGVCLMLLASGLGVLCQAWSGSNHWPVREQETIQKTLTLSGQPMRLVVDNLSGYVHVTGSPAQTAQMHAGMQESNSLILRSAQVRVVAHKTIRAETESDLNQARSEVKLDMTEQPGSVSIEYTAPWRCKGGCDGCCQEHKHFYDVTYDIDIDAPRDARMAVSTVNGELRLDQTEGDFDVRGVNGGIRMSGVRGSGDIQTVNGSVTVQFAGNPSRNCTFKSVNGELDAHFQSGLSADLFFKTFNGQVYSDFDVTPLPVPAGETERHNGMFVYRSNRLAGGRAGRGGPQLSFDTLNGSIRLHQE